MKDARDTAFLPSPKGKVMSFEVRQIGVVRSVLKNRVQCPFQESENAPEAVLEIDSRYEGALEGLASGHEILVLTWLHRSDRSRLKVHPRGNRENSMKGVFATRSPDRPNPIGFHKTWIVSFDQPLSITVNALEVVDLTPVIDIKPVI